MKCLRRPPQFGCYTAKFELECFRLPYRYSSSQLLPTAIGKFEEIFQSALGHTQDDRAMQ